MMTKDYLIRTGPEQLRKTDYCFDCEQIIVPGEKIFIVGYGNKPNEWAKVHEECAKKSDHWDLWQVQESTLIIGDNSAVSIEKKYNVIKLKKGTYDENKKYAITDVDDKIVYQTSRAERAAGVEEFLNEWK